MKTIMVASASQTISSNTTIMPDGFGGWIAQNIGIGKVVVDGFVLEPGEKLDCFASLPPEVVWSSSISIVFEQAGGQLRFDRLKYSQRKDEQQ